MTRITKAQLAAENEALRMQLAAALREKARIENELDGLRERHATSILGERFRRELREEAAKRARPAAEVPPWLAARRALIVRAKALAAEGRTVFIRAGELVVR